MTQARDMTPEQVSAYIAEAGRKAWEVPDVPASTPRRTIKSVGIIGAGTMGGGISMNFATAGFEVRILETKQEALDRGLSVVRGNYQRSADKGRFPQDEVETRMGRIQGTLDMQSLADCDLVIEAVFEDMDIKKKIFTDLDRIMKPGAILATNTSALNIDEIASVTSRPGDVIGLHFFSPANVMKLLEIVRADKTSDDVIATCMDLARTINKIAVLVGVCPGFVGNRILFARQAQAQKLVYAGAMPWDVDAARTRSATRFANWIAAARRPAPAITTMMRVAIRSRQTSPPASSARSPASVKAVRRRRTKSSPPAFTR